MGVVEVTLHKSMAAINNGWAVVLQQLPKQSTFLHESELIDVYAQRLGDLTKTIANGHQQKLDLARLDLISIVDGGDWLVAPFEGVPIVDGYPLRQIAVVWAEIHVDFGGHRERRKLYIHTVSRIRGAGQFLR